MLIETKIAVIFRNKVTGKKEEGLFTLEEFELLRLSSNAGFVVILEAWTMGQCISN